MTLCKFCCSHDSYETIVKYNGLESEFIYFCTKCVSTQENSWEYIQDEETHLFDLMEIQTFIFNLIGMKRDDKHATCIWPTFPQRSLKLIPKMKKKSMEMENIIEMGDVEEEKSTEMEEMDLDGYTPVDEEVRRHLEINVGGKKYTYQKS